MIDYENIAASVPGPEPAETPAPAGRPTQPQFTTETIFESDASPEAIAAAQARLNRPTLPVTAERYQGLAAAKGYKQDDFSGNRLQKVRYTHEAMIDVLIAEPTITQNELAKRFEMSVSWVSIVLGSDSFQAALTKRREELTDPFLIATIEERFRGLASQSLEVIAENLEKTRNTDLALKALDMSAKALGFGARAPNPTGAIQNNFVVQLPPKMADSTEWAQTHGRTIEQS